MLKKDNVFILNVVRDELLVGGDDLTDWLKDLTEITYFNHKRSDIVTVYASIMQHLAESPYYQPSATAEWARESVADPWLIAAANVENGIIVTNEKKSGFLDINRPAKAPHIPNVVNEFGVEYIDTYTFMRQLKIVL